jgi:addiction module HigA family antidote
MNRGKKLPPIHPGEILNEEFLKPLDMSMYRLADELHVPPNRITQIVNGARSVTSETALRLARYFGTSPEFWLNLQARYDLEIARDQYEEQISSQINPKAA